ncbi:lytic transglycosylase domain-containing protein [Rhodocyclus tenuis]|uniref:Lytic transglycosylase domain-containing protein n=1 Tax=Rhodocyclus gracilis TaxID=2929842 RepID=A0ABX0WFB6_9RHOO|nr:lytic transglycosylase domain-containing protein [Rhodocyclus gracilis]NJA88405.1 lytic transglycosylase domain-containing protein [Rhodocyclus gracilis]
MKPFSAISFALTAVLAALLAPLPAAADVGDDRFLAARDAYRLGDRAKLERIAPDLRGYELEPYIDYWLISPRLKDMDAGTIRSFLTRHDKSFLAERLRSDWLKLLASRQQWAEFDAEVGKLAQPDQDIVCYTLQSRRARGDATASDDALPLWLNLLEPPDACVPVIESLIVDKRVLADDAWARIRRQFEANKMAAARLSMNYLPPTQTPDSSVVDAVIDKPMPWLVRLPADFGNNRALRELAALAIQRIARSDPRVAADQLTRIESRLQASERSWAWAQIGWLAAQRHLPEALDDFRRAGNASLGDEAIQWKARAALRAQDWAALRTTIEKMPPALAALPDWTYWLGRAYRAGGRVEEANALFARIAGQPNFYGNLADDELNRPTQTPPRARPPTRDELNQVAAQPGIQRALTFFRLNLRFEAVREWNWALRGMNDRELLAAAEIARRSDIFDRSIATADRTKNEHDFSLRYPAPFADQVRPAARNQSLDEGWVYGLMRQESRFVTDARSSVGASGLMQLMPATAKWVAKKIGLKDYQHGRVGDADVNVLLGTSYMRMVLDSLDDQPVLASAAYNAGPARARKWRADRPLEGAIYAETIPFSETRDYVKKVMSNSVYYSAQFDGRPQSLKARLGVIGPRTGADGANSDLP